MNSLLKHLLSLIRSDQEEASAMARIYSTPLLVLIMINIFVILIPTIIYMCLGIIQHCQGKPCTEKSTAKDTLKRRLDSLLTVKTMVTLILTEVFAYQIIANNMDNIQEFMTVYTVVIAFYFGTQAQKNQDEGKGVGENEDSGKKS